MSSSAGIEPGNPYASPRNDVARPAVLRRRGGWWSALGTVVARTWVAFSVSAFSVAILLNAYLDRENLLQSDDPYIPALLVAVFCAGFALVRGLAKAAGGSVKVQRLAHFGAMAAAVVFLLTFDAVYPGIEVRGLWTFLAMVIALSGAAVYPFVSARPSKLYLVLASIPGVPFVAGYGHALTVMHARWP